MRQKPDLVIEKTGGGEKARLFQRLDRLAEKRSRSVNSLVLQAISEFLDKTESGCEN